MTPLELEILLHYHARTDDYRDGDFSALAVRRAIDKFRDRENLIEEWPMAEKQLAQAHQCYRLTQRGRVFVEALKEVPLPQQVWVMPDRCAVNRSAESEA